MDSEENDFSQVKFRDIHINNYTKNISRTGAGIRTDVYLPVSALIELEFTSKGIREQIKTFGKVKWIKVIIQDKAYDVGVEFCGPPDEAIHKLDEYIGWKLKDNLKKKSPTPGNGDNFLAPEEKQHPLKSDDKKTVATEKPHQDKIKTVTKIAILPLGAIILTVTLLNAFGYLPELERLFPFTSKKEVAEKPVSVSVTGQAALPQAPGESQEAVSASEVTLPPETRPVPKATEIPSEALVSEATQKIKVIGNSDSKRYHLPGMKYYNAVKTYHRVEFDSEADAIKAGYVKAPR